MQDYLARFGARKVEANALVTRAVAGRQLCEDAIKRYVRSEGIASFEASTRARRLELQAVVRHVVRERYAGGARG